MTARLSVAIIPTGENLQVSGCMVLNYGHA